MIYPSAAAWKNTPDITQGATVRKDQVLLLMPDLTKMQVKVGIHESIIDRVDLAIAEANLRSAKNMLSHAIKMAESGYVSELEVEERTFAVERAKLAVEINQTNIEVLEEFTKAEELETLNGNLAAVKATHAANVERAEMKVDDSGRSRSWGDHASSSWRSGHETRGR